MTENPDQVSNRKQRRDIRKRRCVVAVGIVLLLLLLLSIIALILALTVFKAKEPRTKLLSVTVEGIAPRVSLPVVRIDLNITCNLKILVENRNYASFKHGLGKSILLYNGNQVGEADIDPGKIPARDSTTVACRLTMEVDEMISNVKSLIADVLRGELVIQTRTRMPGRVNFLGIFRKHAVAISVCQITIGLTHLKVRSQDCIYKTKF